VRNTKYLLPHRK